MAPMDQDGMAGRSEGRADMTATTVIGGARLEPALWYYPEPVAVSSEKYIDEASRLGYELVDGSKTIMAVATYAPHFRQSSERYVKLMADEAEKIGTRVAFGVFDPLMIEHVLMGRAGRLILYTWGEDDRWHHLAATPLCARCRGMDAPRTNARQRALWCLDNPVELCRERLVESARSMAYDLLDIDDSIRRIVAFPSLGQEDARRRAKLILSHAAQRDCRAAFGLFDSITIETTFLSSDRDIRLYTLTDDYDGDWRLAAVPLCKDCLWNVYWGGKREGSGDERKKDA
jgi:hypothetical protein